MVICRGKKGKREKDMKLINTFQEESVCLITGCVLSEYYLSGVLLMQVVMCDERSQASFSSLDCDSDSDNGVLLFHLPERPRCK